MNPESVLKLQSYLDNELPSSEALEVAEWLKRDAQAQSLCEELRSMKSLMAANELEPKLPESREFYWSKIERAIAPPTVNRTAQNRMSLPSWCFRIVAPLLGAVMLMALAVVVLKPGILPQRIASYFHEIDTPLEEDNAISFHSQEAGMTVVWIAAK